VPAIGLSREKVDLAGEGLRTLRSSASFCTSVVLKLDRVKIFYCFDSYSSLDRPFLPSPELIKLFFHWAGRESREESRLDSLFEPRELPWSLRPLSGAVMFLLAERSELNDWWIFWGTAEVCSTTSSSFSAVAFQVLILVNSFEGEQARGENKGDC
jgi:hypothetical protein